MGSRSEVKVVLLTPPVSFRRRYGPLAGAGSSMPALGLLYLAAFLRKEGFTPYVVEASALGLSVEETLKAIEEISPRYVGITSTTLTIFQAGKLAEGIKALSPDVKVIVGGPHMTAVPEETMERFRAFDLGVLGEGERTLAELIGTLEGGGSLEDVEGIAFREGGRIRTTHPRKFIENLDLCPFPAWDLLPDFPRAYRPPPFKVMRLPAVSLVTSRGCPYRCIFCDTSVFGRRTRAHSADYVLEMVGELYRRYGVREVIFEDDTFLVSKERVLRICEGLLRNGMKLSWSCNSRADLVDGEVLREMKRAGCWRISFGIESGDQRILDGEMKGLKLEQVERAVRLTAEAGISAKGFFMVGHPGETGDTLEKTLEFAKKLPLSDITVTALTPLPGSKLHEVAHRYGRFEDDWAKMNLLDVVFVPWDLTEGKIVRFRKRMLREFYLRPRVIGSYLRRVLRNVGLLPGVLRGFVAFLKAAL